MAPGALLRAPVGVHCVAAESCGPSQNQLGASGCISQLRRTVVGGMHVRSVASFMSCGESFWAGATAGLLRGPAMDLQAIADAAGAGPDVRRYLLMRGVTSAGTLAMLAPDESTFRDVVIAPLLAGFGVGADRVLLQETDRPIAAAVLLFMRKLALDSQAATQPPGPAAPEASAANSGATGTGTAAKDADKVPRSLPPGVWTEQIKKYEAVEIHGRTRVFPQQKLLGAESSLAKLWHQLKVTRDFAPLPLGEIMSRRSFDATGAVNALSKRKLSKELIVDVDRDRLVAEDAEDSWEPRSMLAVIDALDALRFRIRT